MPPRRAAASASARATGSGGSATRKNRRHTSTQNATAAAAASASVSAAAAPTAPTAEDPSRIDQDANGVNTPAADERKEERLDEERSIATPSPCCRSTLALFTDGDNRMAPIAELRLFEYVHAAAANVAATTTAASSPLPAAACCRRCWPSAASSIRGWNPAHSLSGAAAAAAVAIAPDNSTHSVAGSGICLFAEVPLARLCDVPPPVTAVTSVEPALLPAAASVLHAAPTFVCHSDGKDESLWPALSAATGPDGAVATAVPVQLGNANFSGLLRKLHHHAHVALVHFSDTAADAAPAGLDPTAAAAAAGPSFGMLFPLSLHAACIMLLHQSQLAALFPPQMARRMSRRLAAHMATHRASDAGVTVAPVAAAAAAGARAAAPTRHSDGWFRLAQPLPCGFGRGGLERVQSYPSFAALLSPSYGGMVGADEGAPEEEQDVRGLYRALFAASQSAAVQPLPADAAAVPAATAPAAADADVSEESMAVPALERNASQAATQPLSPIDAAAVASSAVDPSPGASVQDESADETCASLLLRVRALYDSYLVEEARGPQHMGALFEQHLDRELAPRIARAWERERERLGVQGGGTDPAAAAPVAAVVAAPAADAVPVAAVAAAASSSSASSASASAPASLPPPDLHDPALDHDAAAFLVRHTIRLLREAYSSKTYETAAAVREKRGQKMRFLALQLHVRLRYVAPTLPSAASTAGEPTDPEAAAAAASAAFASLLKECDMLLRKFSATFDKGELLRGALSLPSNDAARACYAPPVPPHADAEAEASATVWHFEPTVRMLHALCTKYECAQGSLAEKWIAAWTDHTQNQARGLGLGAQAPASSRSTFVGRASSVGAAAAAAVVPASVARSVDTPFSLQRAASAASAPIMQLIEEEQAAGQVKQPPQQTQQPAQVAASLEGTWLSDRLAKAAVAEKAARAAADAAAAAVAASSALVLAPAGVAAGLKATHLHLGRSRLCHSFSHMTAPRIINQTTVHISRRNKQTKGVAGAAAGVGAAAGAAAAAASSSASSNNHNTRRSPRRSPPGRTQLQRTPSRLPGSAVKSGGRGKKRASDGALAPHSGSGRASAKKRKLLLDAPAGKDLAATAPPVPASGSTPLRSSARLTSALASPPAAAAAGAPSPATRSRNGVGGGLLRTPARAAAGEHDIRIEETPVRPGLGASVATVAPRAAAASVPRSTRSARRLFATPTKPRAPTPPSAEGAVPFSFLVTAPPAAAMPAAASMFSGAGASTHSPDVCIAATPSPASSSALRTPAHSGGNRSGHSSGGSGGGGAGLSGASVASRTRAILHMRPPHPDEHVHAGSSATPVTDSSLAAAAAPPAVPARRALKRALQLTNSPVVAALSAMEARGAAIKRAKVASIAAAELAASAAAAAVAAAEATPSDPTDIDVAEEAHAPPAGGMPSPPMASRPNRALSKVPELSEEDGGVDNRSGPAAAPSALTSPTLRSSPRVEPFSTRRPATLGPSAGALSLHSSPASASEASSSVSASASLSASNAPAPAAAATVPRPSKWLVRPAAGESDDDADMDPFGDVDVAPPRRASSSAPPAHCKPGVVAARKSTTGSGSSSGSARRHKVTGLGGSGGAGIAGQRGSFRAAGHGATKAGLTPGAAPGVKVQGSAHHKRVQHAVR